MRLVTFLHQVVDIELRQQPVLASQLDMPHGAGCRRPPGGKKCVNQRAQGTNGVGAGLPGTAQNKNLDRSQLPQGYIQFKIFEQGSDGRMQISLQLVITQTGYV